MSVFKNVSFYSLSVYFFWIFPPFLVLLTFKFLFKTLFFIYFSGCRTWLLLNISSLSLYLPYSALVCVGESFWVHLYDLKEVAMVSEWGWTKNAAEMQRWNTGRKIIQRHTPIHQAHARQSTQANKNKHFNESTLTWLFSACLADISLSLSDLSPSVFFALM